MKQQLSVVLVAWCSFAVVRAQNDTGDADITTLNYALSLEHLEYAFYRDGLAQLGNISSGNPIVDRIEQIRDQEAQHVADLTSAITALGGTPVSECQYNFSWDNPVEFINVARALENVGTSAYTGAAYLIEDSKLLTTAATIATVEARHAAYLNHVANIDPFPHAYDSPLDMQSVLTLASPWIVNCSDSLNVTPRAWVRVDPVLVSHGENVNVTTNANLDSENGTYCVFYAGAQSNSTLLQSEETGSGNGTGNATTNWWCSVPDNDWEGDTYLFLSLNNTYDLWDTDKILAGPAIVFLRD